MTAVAGTSTGINFSSGMTPTRSGSSLRSSTGMGSGSSLRSSTGMGSGTPLRSSMGSESSLRSSTGMEAESRRAFHHKLMLKGYGNFIPILDGMGVTSEETLLGLNDSVLRARDFGDGERLQLIRLANDVLEIVLPDQHLIAYAFDVDGTITPHPGRDPKSLWFLNADGYYASLSDATKDRMVRLLSTVVGPLILISRNDEHTVRDFLYLLNPEFEARIDNKFSSFRKTGAFPTDHSKVLALRHLIMYPKPVFYLDDDIHEYNQCQIQANTYPTLGCYHADKWIGIGLNFMDLSHHASIFADHVSKLKYQ